MTIVLTGILILSSATLLFVVIRAKPSFEWLRRFAIHIVIAALGLYAINYSGLLSGWEIPLNPATIGTVMVLGLPGIVLIAGLRMALF
ncbi:pro-sigmaK processing inhibitor BofA family protein [Paenibacillus sp. MMS18-CY102]|uniref:pro-sigmaK processing inhibitor BofA family protein n=1 Tax=Paenibacillus sp. MMS18-CY102 TaxID=2682849 RepID=UPI001365AEF3|nr:pro-sigmaK processing inhibitor BofA family protein [Paenibacillus sp. MMS18-CY102]MWC31051.1 pro-sigmaK processing inhibitor BofA [Paenibacillus sp. MMS18-CY102]